MNFNIGDLKKIINDMPDEAVIAGLSFGDKLHEFSYLKRVLLLEKDGEQMVLFNPQGTHYFDLVEKQGWKHVNHWTNFEFK